MAILVKNSTNNAFNLSTSWTPAQIPTNLDTVKIDVSAAGNKQTVNNTAGVNVGSIWVDESFGGAYFRIGSSTYNTTAITLQNNPDTANGAPNYSVYVAAGKEFSFINALTVAATAGPHKVYLGAGSTFAYNNYGISPNATFAGSGRIALYGGGAMWLGLTSSTGVYAGGFDLYNGYLQIRGDSGTLPLGLASNTVVFNAEVGGSVGIRLGNFNTIRTIPNPLTFTSDAYLSPNVPTVSQGYFESIFTGAWSGSGKLSITGTAARGGTVFYGPSSAASYSGIISISDAAMWVAASSYSAFTSFNPLPNVPRYELSSTGSMTFAGGPYDVNAEIHSPALAADAVAVSNAIAGTNDGVSFKTSLVNIKHNANPATATTQWAGGFNVLTGLNNRTGSTASVIDFPDRVTLNIYGGAVHNAHLKYKGVGGVAYSTAFDLLVNTTYTISDGSWQIYADHSDPQPITLSGNFTRYGLTSTSLISYLYLRGSNASNNTISGNIGPADGNVTTPSQRFGLAKLDAGKWVLAGDNTYSAGTYVDQGTLGIASPNALRQSFLDWRNGFTGTLTFEGGFSNYNFGALLASSAGARTLTIPAGVTVTVGTASWLTSSTNHDFGCVLSGDGNFKKVGPHTLFLYNVTGLIGNIIVDSGGIWPHPSTSGANLRTSSIFKDAASITVNGTSTLTDHFLPSTATTTLIPTITINDSATYATGCYSAAGGGEVSNTFTGTIQGTGTLLLVCYNSSLTGNRISSIKTKSLPGKLLYSSNAGPSLTRRGIYRWVGESNTVYPTSVQLSVGDSTVAANGTFLFSNDSPNLSVLELQGDIDKQRIATSVGTAAATLEVAGTGDLVFSGVIRDSDTSTIAASSSLGIWKYGTNTLTISGTNTFRGDTRVQAGVLRLSNARALQNSGLDWTTSTTDTGTLDLTTSGITEYFLGGLKSTTASARVLSIPAGITLTVGNSLSLDHTYSATLSGGATTTIKKTGANTQYIGTNNTAFTGAVVCDGTSTSILWLGVNLTTTASRTFPNAASLTVNNGATFEYLSADANVTHPVTVNGGKYSALKFSASDTGGVDLTQGISGVGVLEVNAPSFSLTGTYYARTKSTTLPGILRLTGNPPNPRFARFIYTGVEQSYSSAVNLQVQAAGTLGFSIYNQGTGTLTLTGNITKDSTGYSAGQTQAATLTLGDASDTQDIVITGNILQAAGETGALSVTKAGTRKLTLNGTGHTFTGSFTQLAGTVTLRTNQALGAAAGAAATVFTAGTVEIDGSGSDLNLNKQSSPFTLGNASTTLTIKNISGTNNLTVSSAALAGNVTFDIAPTTSLTIASGPMSGPLGYTLTKINEGRLVLPSSTSSYLGPTVIRQGTVEVKKLADAGLQSSFGQPAAAQAALAMGADGNTTLLHTGNGTDSTNRSINFQGAPNTTLTLECTGAGSVNLTSGGTLSFTVSGQHTLTLQGTNSLANTMGRVVGDAVGGGKTYLTKLGSNTWNVTQTPTMTGDVSVSAGTLRFDGVARTLLGGLVLNGGTLSNGSGVLTFTNTMIWESGVIESVIAGTGLSITASTGQTRLAPQLGTNPNLNGTANLNNGSVVKLVTETITTTSNGIVTGSLNVVVNNGAVLNPITGTLQRGRARYNGTVTFNAGATFRIGGTL